MEVSEPEFFEFSSNTSSTVGSTAVEAIIFASGVSGNAPPEESLEDSVVEVFSSLCDGSEAVEGVSVTEMEGSSLLTE